MTINSGYIQLYSCKDVDINKDTRKLWALCHGDHQTDRPHRVTYKEFEFVTVSVGTFNVSHHVYHNTIVTRKQFVTSPGLINYIRLKSTGC